MLSRRESLTLPVVQRRIVGWIGVLKAFGRTRAGLLTGFGVIHAAYLGYLLPTIIAGDAQGDLPLYRQWAEAAMHGRAPLIHEDWVYPAGALGPIVLADVLGPYLYQLLWILITAAGNFVALWVLTKGFRNRAGFTASWYWLLIEVVLAPVAMLRLEGVAAPLVIAALVLIARRPVIAGALLAAAAWIKVWPAAVVVAAFTGGAKRWWIALGGAVTTLVVVGAVWLAGGGKHILSFVTMQNDRTLQLEAPVATPWVWAAIAHVHGAEIYQNYELATREVTGPGSRYVAAAMGAAMAIAFVLVLVAIVTGRRQISRAGFGAAATRRAEVRLIVLGAFTLVAALIVFNKVGSPQYMLWIAPVIAAGLLVDPIRWARPAWGMAAIGLLTSIIFPLVYMPLVTGNPVAASVLTARNLAVVAIFVWSCVDLSRCAADPSRLAWTPRRRSRRITPPQEARISDATGPLRSIA